jgi:hypothetical protein
MASGSDSCGGGGGSGGDEYEGVGQLGQALCYGADEETLAPRLHAPQ